MDYKKIIQDRCPVYVTKIKDTKFNGHHPNGINVGYDFYGIIGFLEEGMSMEVAPIKLDDRRYLTTSRVTQIEDLGDKINVHTNNSIYEIKEA